MARIITQQAVKAFMAGHNFNKSNTEVILVACVCGCPGGLVKMTLFGNTIATRMGGSIRLSTAGWPTSTTKERLNGILDALNMPRVYTKNHALHDWHGRPWADSDVLCSAN